MGSESRKDGLGSSTMFLRLLLLDDDPSRPPAPAFPAAAGLVDLVMDQASLANLLRLFTMAPPPSSGSCDENQKVGMTRSNSAKNSMQEALSSYRNGMKY